MTARLDITYSVCSARRRTLHTNVSRRLMVEVAITSAIYTLIVFQSDLVASRGHSGGRWKLARLHRVAQPGTPARGRCGNAKPAALMLG